jgi:hypothetical protein
VSTAILYLAIVAIWAGVLVPRLLRRSQQRSSSTVTDETVTGTADLADVMVGIAVGERPALVPGATAAKRGASDAPLDLTLSVQSGEGEPKDVQVAWQRSDLEAVLGRVEAGPVTLSFDRGELYQALEHPDFEGHGMREIVLLVAAASSSVPCMEIRKVPEGRITVFLPPSALVS